MNALEQIYLDWWRRETDEGRIFTRYDEALRGGDGGYISDRSLEHNIGRLRIFAGRCYRWADEMAAVEHKSIQNEEYVSTIRRKAGEYSAWCNRWEKYVTRRDRWLRNAAIVVAAVILTSPLWAAALVVWWL